MLCSFLKTAFPLLFQGENQGEVSGTARLDPREVPPWTRGHGRFHPGLRCYLAWAILLLLLLAVPSLPQGRSARIAIDLQKDLGPMEIDRFGLGQGGLSDAPMWEDRIPEIRSLHPRLIRLFIQEYFDVYPKKGTYHWEPLDRSVQTILDTGAQPLMCIAIKPKVLFPAINQDVVEPDNYAEWEELSYQMVKHFKEGQKNIQYWEVSN